MRLPRVLSARRVNRCRPLALGFAALALASCAPERPRPPRGIVVVLIDAMRADRLGLAGSPVAATPALDRLGPESVVFRNAFVQATWTRPSVPTLLTGLYPSEHGLTDFVASGNRVEGKVLAPEVTTLAEGMQAAGYRTALVGYQAQLSPRFGMDQGFDFFNNNTMGAAKIRNRFLGWLDEAPGEPFFAYLHFLDIHWPYCPPAETYGKLGALGTIALCENWRRLREEIRAGRVTFDDGERRALAARYAEELLALDGELGALFAALAERKLWDDTLIVVTSDHGEELAERGGIEHGHTMYDELMRVPFLWRLPPAWGGAGGRTDDTLIETRSLLPTLFELVGRPVPAGVTAPSLLSWVLGRPPGRAPYEYVAAESNGIYAVRTERWKLVLTPATRRTELYDLAADPGERADLAATRPEELAALQADLRRWRNGLHPVGAGSTALDDATAAELRSLGYLQ